MIARLAALAATFLFLVGHLGTTAQAGEPVDFNEVVAEITARGEAAVATYSPETALDAADEVSSLYFDVFEESGMELAIGMRNSGLKAELESLFGRLTALASKRASAELMRAA